VTAFPDPRKGERLVLVTTRKDATRAEFMAFAREKGASELMVPADVLVVERMPMLGSGKIDAMGVAKLARERAGFEQGVRGTLVPVAKISV
jgi:acyl-[acyl-carrier-protein]-phospholipid O-acyltransferase/long-chain-fatty-acid--[acyl-carrier-protein] ligase